MTSRRFLFSIFCCLFLFSIFFSVVLAALLRGGSLKETWLKFGELQPPQRQRQRPVSLCTSCVFFVAFRLIFRRRFRWPTKYLYKYFITQMKQALFAFYLPAAAAAPAARLKGHLYAGHKQRARDSRGRDRADRRRGHRKCKAECKESSGGSYSTNWDYSLPRWCSPLAQPDSRQLLVIDSKRCNWQPGNQAKSGKGKMPKRKMPLKSHYEISFIQFKTEKHDRNVGNSKYKGNY